MDRVALVTGGANGIGRAIAQRLSSEGANVAVLDIDLDAATKVARGLGGTSYALEADVSNSASVEAAFDELKKRSGRLDILVNNAGVTRDAPLHKMGRDDWTLVNDVILLGTYLCTKAAAQMMRSNIEGEVHNRKVVNISSVSGVYGREISANYSAAKAGVIGFSRAMAREWAPKGINVNVVAPGFIGGTRLTAPRASEDGLGMDLEFRQQVVDSIPLGREGQPDDVASAVAFLSSSESDYVTGQVVEVHGGLEIIRL